jgi:hypothetical protein
VDACLLDGKYALSEDDDGQCRLIDIEICMKFTAEAYEKSEFDAIEDAYGINNDIVIEKSDVDMKDVLFDEDDIVNLKGSFYIEDELPAGSEVYSINSRAIITDSQIMNGKINLQGICYHNVIYTTHDDRKPVCLYEIQNEFDKSIDLPPEIRMYDDSGDMSNMDREITVKLIDANAAIKNGRNIEISGNLTLNVKIINYMTSPIIVDIYETDPKDAECRQRKSGMIIYFIQPDDNMWKIAKKYRTTIGRIMKYNDFLEGTCDKLNLGQQILIPQHECM